MLHRDEATYPNLGAVKGASWFVGRGVLWPMSLSGKVIILISVVASHV